jgi:HD-like signal output (HDOD) protein
MTPREYILNQLSVIDDLPTYPQIAFKIRKKLKDPDVSASDVALILENDPVIAAQVLKVANSALYNFGPRSFGNVRDALVRIGFAEVEKICLAISAMHMFLKPSSPLIDPKAFWRHSILVALTARTIIGHVNTTSEKMKSINVFDAFTAGLFHDLGIMVFDQYFYGYYKRVREYSEKENIALHLAEREVMGIDHGEIASILLDAWDIPIFICESVKYHHEPEICRDDARIYCQAVHLSEVASEINRDEKNLKKEGASQEDFSTSFWHDLGLDDDDISSIMYDVEKSGEHADILIKMGLG